MIGLKKFFEGLMCRLKQHSSWVLIFFILMGFFSWCAVPALSIVGLVLATAGLFFLAFSAPPEFFFSTCVLSLAVVCTTQHVPLFIIGYSLYVVLPFSVINIYKKLCEKKSELKEMVSVFDFISPLFFLITFVMTWIWRLFLLESGCYVPSFFVFCGPGVVSLGIGALLVVLICIFSPYFSYPMRHKDLFSMTAFDYVWLVLYELAWIFLSSQGYPPNLLFAAVFPFMMKGLLWLQGYLRACGFQEKVSAGILLASVCLVLPACLLALYALFEPWIHVVSKSGNRRMHNGNH